MKEKRPFIITLIGDIGVLSAFVWIMTLFPNFVEQLGIELRPLPFFTVGIMKGLTPLLLLVISLGYLRLKIWGYWLMLAINMLFLLSYIILLIDKQSVSIGMLEMVIKLLFIFPTRRYFISEKIVTPKNI